MKREIILDTETTGLDPQNGDRVIEIAAIEMLNGSITNNEFHIYINPEREIPDSAFRVHGISNEMVADKPKFREIVDDFLEFIADDPIVAHNAEFDLKFLNSELQKIGRALLGNDRMIDTLAIARKKHPGSSNSLDALCTRYGVDRSRRVKHGALIDAEILAEVYIELNGGRQTSLSLHIRKEIRRAEFKDGLTARPKPLPAAITAGDEANHRVLVDGLGGAAFWRRYQSASGGGDPSNS